MTKNTTMTSPSKMTERQLKGRLTMLGYELDGVLAEIREGNPPSDYTDTIERVRLELYTLSHELKLNGNGNKSRTP